MFRKVLHIVLLITLVTAPVMNAYAAISMQSFSSIPASLVTATDPASISNYHHIHNTSANAANAANADEDIGFDSQTEDNKTITSSHSQACCADCDAECGQGCLVYIMQLQTLFLEHSFNAFISFMEYPYFLIPANLLERPPRLS